jgi:hypothetical protein
MKWKGFGRKQSWPNWSNILAFFLEKLRKTTEKPQSGFFMS